MLNREAVLTSNAGLERNNEPIRSGGCSREDVGEFGRGCDIWCVDQMLLGAQISLGRLNRSVAQEELDLFKLRIVPA